MLAGDGYFYGMTSFGGTSNFGTVFKMTSAGGRTTVANFNGTTGANTGNGPYGSLVQGADGNFYGMTRFGGTNNLGTVFRMTSAGVLTTLVDFTGTTGANPGKNPRGSLVQGVDGNFYGMTYQGGTGDLGTVFKMTAAGVRTTLVDFTGTTGAIPGSNPNGSLVQGGDGYFYGTTINGGTGNLGTVFKLGFLTTAAESSPATQTGKFSDVDGNASVTLTASTGTITQDNAAGTWSWTATVADGPAASTVTITATDTANATTTAPFTFTVTNATPTAVISAPVSANEDASVDFTFTATDPGSTDQSTGFAWSLDYGDGTGVQSIAAGTASPLALTHTFVTPGTYTVTATATDKDSAVSTTVSKVISILDLTSPVVASHTNVGPIEATAPDGAIVTYVAATATDNTGDTPTITYSKASDSTFAIGSTLVTITATDAAGNVGTGTFTVTVADTTAPETTITSSTPVENSTTASIAFTGSDLVGVSGFEGQLDGAPYAAITAPVNLTGLANGPHTYRVRARDAAGNVDASPATVTWTTLLNTTPVVTVVSTGKLNKQTGLFEIIVKMTNTTARPINGFRLNVDYRDYKIAYPGLRLYKAKGSKKKFKTHIDYPFPVAANGVVSMKLRFYSRNRTLPTVFKPKLKVKALKADQVTGPKGKVVSVRSVRLPDKSIRIEFPSVIGKWYRVRYSEDKIHWHNCLVPIKAGTTLTRWIDSGPPFTDVPPSPVANRYYRVNEVAAP